MPWLINPRIGVAAHLGGVMSGTFLIAGVIFCLSKGEVNGPFRRL
jgi:hypothetical protein